MRSAIRGNTSQKEVAQEVFRGSLHNQQLSLVLLGISAQGFTDGMRSVIGRIDHCGLGWLLISKSGQDRV